MSRTLLIVVVGLVLVGCRSGQEVQPAETDKSALAWYSAVNSLESAAPTKSFRQGHVSPRKLDPDGGKVIQRYPVKSPLRFQPAVVDGRIYVTTQDGRLVCIDTGNRSLTGWPMWGGNAAHTGVVAKEEE